MSPFKLLVLIFCLLFLGGCLNTMIQKLPGDQAQLTLGTSTANLLGDDSASIVVRKCGIKQGSVNKPESELTIDDLMAPCPEILAQGATSAGLLKSVGGQAAIGAGIGFADWGGNTTVNQSGGGATSSPAVTNTQRQSISRTRDR